MEQFIQSFLVSSSKLIQTIAVLGISKALFNIYKYQHSLIKEKDKEIEELKQNKICTNCKELEI